MADKTELVQFAKNLKWEDYINDTVVESSLQQIHQHLNQKKKEGDSKDVDISGAKRVKLVVVGDGAVGKTSLLISYATGEFPKDYLPTVFENYTAQMKRGGEVILLHLWDTAGQEDYDRLRPLSYPNADVVLLCFSTINQASHDNIREKWAPEVHHYIPNIPHILVGTKVDLREEKIPDPTTGKFEPLSSEQGQQMSREIGATKYMEVSSKTGKGVQEVFEEAVRLVLKDRETSDRSRSQSVETGPKSKTKKGKKGSNGNGKEGCVLL